MSPNKTELEIERSIERDIDWAVEIENQEFKWGEQRDAEQLELIEDEND